MQTKNKQLLIRVSENELAHITANAQEAGLTVSAYLREAGLNYAPLSDISVEVSGFDVGEDVYRKHLEYVAKRKMTH